MIRIFISSVLLVLSLHAYAGVTVLQNLGSDWVGNPVIMVTNQPSINLNSAEGNWGSGSPSLGQSFTAPVSGTLTNIQMYVTGKNTTNVLFLYDLGVAMRYANAQPTSITPGSNGVSGNLLSSNLTIVMANQPSGASVMQLTFSGADAVQLIGGHEYLFNFVHLAGSSQSYWHRTGGGTDVYSGGAGYRQFGLINGNNKIDFSLSVSLVNTSAAPTVYNCVVNWTNVYQRIDGFGASSAWRSSWRDDIADMFFSTNGGVCSTLNQSTNFNYTGIGLSLLRTRIVPGGGTWEDGIMQRAQARGAKVWSTPWTPAPVATYKSNGSTNGGNFIGTPANYQSYAAQLAGYVVNMANTYGVSIYALSVQNEPGLATSYESCVWTPQQIRDFVPYLRNALVASNKSSVKIIAAEGEHWETNYYAAALMDPLVATNVNIIACHNYDNSPPSGIPENLPRYANPDAVLWETEVSKLAGNGPFDPGMNDAMYWAGRLHLFMTHAQVSAWHYWWLISNNPDNEGLTDTNGIPAKRMYVLGQYSRFVRPNYYRIDEGNNNPYAVLVSAYKDPVGKDFAIVVANTNTTSTTQSFYFNNFNATTATPWITSSNLSLVPQAPVPVSNNSFSYVIPGMSVVTFVGKGLVGGSPNPDPIPNQTVNAGAMLLVTNTAQSANPPLSWTLLSGPTNATVTAGGLFSWTPLSSQANSTNLVTLRVTDNASLSATNNFYVIVNPVVGNIPTVTTLTSSTSNTVYGTAVTLTATVNPAPTDGQTVAFKIGGTTLGTGVLSGGMASYTTTSTQLVMAGSPHLITALYGGDGNYQNSVSTTLALSVTAANITVASGLAANNKIYDGTTSATISSNNVVLFGVIAADLNNVRLSTNGCTAAFANKNAGNGVAIVINGLTLTGSAAGNYTLTPPGLIANITPAPVTLATGSGSMRITNNFTGGNNQFEVYNGLNGFSPPLNGSLFTNFQCDVRFAPGSAIQPNSSGVVTFGHLQFGTRENFNQDYFGGANYGIDVPATNTGWVHVNIPISVAADPNLANIYDLLIHIYGPTYSPTLIGPSTLWVDNLAFVGPTTNYIIDQFNPAGSGGNSYAAGQLMNVWNNWFGASWVANSWDSTNDAIGLTANSKTYDGATNATITQYDSLVNKSLSGVLAADLLNVSLSTNGCVASFSSVGPGTNIVVTVRGLTLAGSAGANYVVAPVALSANISGSPLIPTITTLVSSKNNSAYGMAYQLIFQTLPGQMYQVEYKSNLNEAVWMPLEGPLPGTGGSLNVTNDAGAQQGFFRLRISRP